MDISSTLVSNSSQLDNIDLQGGARDFTITRVVLNEGSDQPLSITLAEYGRPWKPGLTMRRLLSEMWGPESDSWVGRRVRLYRDASVTFGKVATGGTRISHATHLDRPITVTLPTAKGKFGEFTVQPLIEAAPEPQSTGKQHAEIVDLVSHLGLDADKTRAGIESVVRHEVPDMRTLTELEAAEVIARLQTKVAAMGVAAVDAAGEGK